MSVERMFKALDRQVQEGLLKSDLAWFELVEYVVGDKKERKLLLKANEKLAKSLN